MNCLVSRFAIDEGLAKYRLCLVETQDTQMTREGEINFASETLSLSLKPQNKHFALVSLRSPVEVWGPLAKPTFHIKTGALIGRLGAAAGLGLVFPPAALPLID